MPDILMISMGVTLLLGQLSQCMLGSRCSSIDTPCFSVKRDVMPLEAVTEMQNKAPGIVG